MRSPSREAHYNADAGVIIVRTRKWVPPLWSRVKTTFLSGYTSGPNLHGHLAAQMGKHRDRLSQRNTRAPSSVLDAREAPSPAVRLPHPQDKSQENMPKACTRTHTDRPNPRTPDRVAMYGLPRWEIIGAKRGASVKAAIMEMTIRVTGTYEHGAEAWKERGRHVCRNGRSLPQPLMRLATPVFTAAFMCTGASKPGAGARRRL